LCSVAELQVKRDQGLVDGVRQFGQARRHRRLPHDAACKIAAGGCETRCSEIARGTPEHEAGAARGIAVVLSERSLDPPHDRGNLRQQARQHRPQFVAAERFAKHRKLRPVELRIISRAAGHVSVRSASGQCAAQPGVNRQLPHSASSTVRSMQMIMVSSGSRRSAAIPAASRRRVTTASGAAPGEQLDDRQIGKSRIGADLAAQLRPVELEQFRVDQHEVRLDGVDLLHRPRSSDRADVRKAGAAQDAHDQTIGQRRIADDQARIVRDLIDRAIDCPNASISGRCDAAGTALTASARS
jgi:hypothetical protein